MSNVENRYYCNGSDMSMPSIHRRTNFHLQTINHLYLQSSIRTHARPNVRERIFFLRVIFYLVRCCCCCSVYMKNTIDVYYFPRINHRS